MADTITGKVWSLDTVVGLVSENPVNIHSFIVRFTTAGIGSCVIATAGSATTAYDTILDLKTTAASTAVVHTLDNQYFFGNQTFSGLRKMVSVNVDTIYVITGIPS